MRNLVIPFALLLLAACAGAGGKLTSDEITALVTKIQLGAESACSFHPAFDSVSTLIGALYDPSAPFVDIAQVGVDAICKAPVTATAMRAGTLQVNRLVRTAKGQTVLIKGSNVQR